MQNARTAAEKLSEQVSVTERVLDELTTRLEERDPSTIALFSFARAFVGSYPQVILFEGKADCQAMRGELDTAVTKLNS